MNKTGTDSVRADFLKTSNLILTSNRPKLKEINPKTEDLSKKNILI